MGFVVRALFKMFTLHKLKQKGELYLLKFLNGVRLGLRASFLVVLLFQIFLCGILLTIYSVYQLIPIEEHLKLYGLLGLGLLFVIVPLSLILWCTSDHTWYQALSSKKHLD
ncbi:MAG: hypothetical protein CL676_08820 [Bdellovibrionaceae bacterium]|nr:hypothetical protein [Pseudobdellovibrionaceae bacterium]|tara:strand:- start:1459 stop:1791 length:333 start_codon:yes stop_codon:yes gene_type:complete